MICKTHMLFLPGKEIQCIWHRQHHKTGKLYTIDEMFPHGSCPILLHTLYPYFLGAYFGAKFPYNEYGDCQVCCPAYEGIDLIVKVRPNDGKFCSEVDSDWRNVIYAEVVNVRGKCDYDYKIGDRIVFPTTRTMRTKYVCPAGVNNVFPFLKFDIPKCIDLNKLRCPDWLEDVKYALIDIDEKI